MYSLSDKAGGFSNNRAYGFSAAFAHGPLNLAAGYLQFNNPGGGVVGTNQNGAIAQGDGSADFVAQRQRIWGVGGNYTFGAGMVGLVWSRTQVDNMASVLSFGLGNYVPLGGGGLRLDNYEVSAKYALTPALTVSVAHTFTDGAYADGGASASPIWHTVMLQTDYSLSRRTDVYLDGVYQHAHGAPADSVFELARDESQASCAHFWCLAAA